MSAAERSTGFEGLRLLLVEDNFLVATEIADLLTQMGCEVVGPVPSVDEGLRLAAREPLAGAILDINIVGGNCGPIAAELRQRRCPFFFITGYASPVMLTAAMTDVKRVLKPVDLEVLRAAIRAEIMTRSRGAGAE